MQPFQLDDLLFSVRESDKAVVVEKEVITGGLVSPPRQRWDVVAQPNKEVVIALRNWLNEWLDANVFVVPPRV